MTREQTEKFEVLKHYATVLRCFNGWVSCHVHGDATGIVYRERSGRKDGVEYGTPSKEMCALAVISAGMFLEATGSKTFH